MINHELTKELLIAQMRHLLYLLNWLYCVFNFKIVESVEENRAVETLAAFFQGLLKLGAMIISRGMQYCCNYI